MSTAKSIWILVFQSTHNCPGNLSFKFQCPQLSSIWNFWSTPKISGSSRCWKVFLLGWCSCSRPAPMWERIQLQTCTGEERSTFLPHSFIATTLIQTKTLETSKSTNSVCSVFLDQLLSMALKRCFFAVVLWPCWRENIRWSSKLVVV